MLEYTRYLVASAGLSLSEKDIETIAHTGQPDVIIQVLCHNEQKNMPAKNMPALEMMQIIEKAVLTSRSSARNAYKGVQ